MTEEESLELQQAIALGEHEPRIKYWEPLNECEREIKPSLLIAANVKLTDKLLNEAKEHDTRLKDFAINVFQVLNSISEAIEHLDAKIEGIEQTLNNYVYSGRH